MFPETKSKQQTNKDGVRATTVQLYPGRDSFEFDQGHVTKNQPITVLILLSESLAYITNKFVNIATLSFNKISTVIG